MRRFYLGASFLSKRQGEKWKNSPCLYNFRERNEKVAPVFAIIGSELALRSLSFLIFVCFFTYFNFIL